MKVCSKCSELKPLTEYSKHEKTRDGLKTTCKKCCSKIAMKSKLKRYGSWSGVYNAEKEHYDLDKRKESSKHWTKHKKDGYYYVYYRSEGNYIGKTDCTWRRQLNHKSNILRLARFVNNTDALIVEAILQRDYDFSGWHSKHSRAHYKQAKQSHKRLAKRIAQRIFTTLK